MTHTLFLDVIIIFALSIAVVYICNRIKVPSIIGFLLTGIIAGPHSLGLIGSHHEVDVFAEIGVVMILFTIGIEFSLKKLMRLKKNILLGGTVQVFFTIIVIFFIANFSGLSKTEAMFLGFLVALSSTAIVLKILQSQGSIDSPQGQIALSVLIFQDLIIVPMMLVTPLMAGAGGDIGAELIELGLKIVILLAFVVIASRWFVPFIMLQIARTRIRELFLLTVLTLCSLVVWFTHEAGLSVALGAFIAGLIVSETDYNHQALGNIIPFKEVFSSFFFVSVGLLLNLSFFIENIGMVLLFTAIVLILKVITANAAALILGYPFRTALLVGFTVFQIGEFSFILSKTGMNYGLISDNFYQLFLAVTVLTMTLTPFMINLSPYLASIAGIFKKTPKKDEVKIPLYKNHLIIIGYGINGRNLARAAKLFGIDYVIIEMNPDTVRQEKAAGENIFYGDAVQEEILHHASIDTVKIVVIAISDTDASRRITNAVHEINPAAYIIVRTRFISEMQTLRELGAHYVIPEEFETSIEIFTLVLSKYLVPRDQIEDFTTEIRSDDYSGFRLSAPKNADLRDLKLQMPHCDFHVIRLKDSSPLHNKTLEEINLRREFDITLLAINRNGETIPQPSGKDKLLSGDSLVLFGSLDKVNDFIEKTS